MVSAGLFCSAAQAATDDVAIGFLPLDSVSTALRKTLSPQGRFVVLTQNGTVRVIDAPEKIAEARRVIGELQKTPALVSLELTLKTGMRRVTRGTSSQPPAETVDIPIPQRIDPPRIFLAPNGQYFVIPAQPRDFQTRRVGPGMTVNISPTGFATLDAQINVSKTSLEGGIAQRFSGTGALEKRALIAVSRRVSDPAALRALAVKLGAVTDAEPAWSTAATELAVTPEVVRDGLILNVTPQIVAVTAASPVARRIPISACAAPILVRRDTPATIDGLPHAQPEFYRLFFGAAGAGDDTITSLTASTAVRYLVPVAK